LSVAEELAKKQREISISEFFERNKQILGYDSPTKALLTVVKELCENSLDACEDAGILPDVRRRGRTSSSSSRRTTGPGS